MNITENGQNYQFMFFDTAGQEDYDKLRPLSYPNSDVIVICYDISCWRSFARVQSHWIKELKDHIPDVPILLVGIGLEKRNDEEFLQELMEKGEKLVSTEEGQRTAEGIQCKEFMEFSLENGDIKQLSDAIFRIALAKKKKKGFFSKIFS